jgi:hypothetical protein
MQSVTPSTKKQTAFRLEPAILDGLREVKERDGIPTSEQVRRALAAWLESKGVKMGRPPSRTRRPR